MAGPVWVMDTECFPNYWLIAFRNVQTGQSFSVEKFEDQWSGQLIFPPGTIVTFNGINYDMPMVSLALAGGQNWFLKKLNDDIILRGLKYWEIEREYNIPLIVLDHIDLMEVAPGQASLKSYGGRMHSKRMRDLPYSPDTTLTPQDVVVVREYCLNDLAVTVDLYNKLLPQIQLRESMSEEYGIDLRSKSDAQIAEAVIKSQIEKITGTKVYRPEAHPEYRFKYQCPDWVGFTSDGMKKALFIIRNVEFSINEKGAVELPHILDSMRLRIGRGVYRMGLGGLHSNEESISHFSDDQFTLVDRDVTSYYPSIILTQRLYPAHLGELFLDVFRSIFERRLTAKESGDKITADALKIVLNGTFGKLGSKWSIFYSPSMLIQVTLTGQLALLMLIESLENIGVEIVSANTDGIVIKRPNARAEEVDAVIQAWEITTGLNTEETIYASLHSKDVNNYIAVKPDGSTKLKGLYAPPGLQKNSTNSICVDAVIAYLTEKTPIETTIHTATDPRKFVTIKKVEGGAVHNGVYLGKSVRWYYSTKGASIHYATNGNKVGKSEGAWPMMELTESVPSDLDYDWYVREAYDILHDVGL